MNLPWSKRKVKFAPKGGNCTTFTLSCIVAYLIRVILEQRRIETKS